MSLQQYLRNNFANAQNSTLYTIEEDTADIRYNCFAFAVGETTKLLLPYTWDGLDENFAEYGYFAIDVNSSLQDGDVEVYAKPTDLDRPIHAHRVTSAASDTCQSKIGRDSIVTHGRDLLQSPKPNSNTQYTYGTVVAVYRYNDALFQEWQDSVYTTSSGRQIKRKDTTTTTSGRPVKKQDTVITKSGRVNKKKTGKTGKSK